MQRNREWSAEQWYAEAKRWYVEQHQGCPHCQTRHCVFRSQWGKRIEYQCTCCDFSTAHDHETGRYLVDAGEELPPQSDLLMGLS